MVFFALLVVGHMISGTDGGVALVGLFGAAIVFFFFVGLRSFFWCICLRYEGFWDVFLLLSYPVIVCLVVSIKTYLKNKISKFDKCNKFWYQWCMPTPGQKKKLLKAKIAVALQDELGRVPKKEEIEQVFLLARVMYKAILGLHFKPLLSALPSESFRAIPAFWRCESWVPSGLSGLFLLEECPSAGGGIRGHTDGKTSATPDHAGQGLCGLQGRKKGSGPETQASLQSLFQIATTKEASGIILYNGKTLAYHYVFMWETGE
jgi:hypothetical protein